MGVLSGWLNGLRVCMPALRVRAARLFVGTSVLRVGVRRIFGGASPSYNVRMKVGQNKARRFRPRFSLRTLFVLVTLVCAYFGAWEATKRYGVRSGNEWPVSSPSAAFVWNERSPVALIIERTEGVSTADAAAPTHRRYYLWLFGPTFRLPFQGKPTPSASGT